MNRIMRITSTAVIAIGVLFLALSIYLDGKINFTLPLVFLTLGAAFTILVFVFSKQWSWASVLYLPAMVSFALGLIFLLNVLTNDWNSWAYAWLLILTGLGFGLALTSRALHWQILYYQVGVGLIILGTSLFAIFGVIAGGRVIQIMAPVLLILGGLALRWLKPEMVFPAWLVKRISPRPSSGSATRDEPLFSETTNPHLPGKEDVGLVETLSERELEVLNMIDQGLTNQEIAARLVLAQSTVKTHINNIYGKLGVQTRTQAIKKSRELRILT